MVKQILDGVDKTNQGVGIGEPLFNGTPDSLIYVDDDGNVAQKNANLNFDPDTNTFFATTITGANVTSGEDPGHTHTGASLSGIDISDDTNLAVSSPITLTDDTVGFDFSTNNIWTGAQIIEAQSSTTTVLILKNASGHSVNIFEHYNFSEVLLFAIDESGDIYLSNHNGQIIIDDEYFLRFGSNGQFKPQINIVGDNNASAPDRGKITQRYGDGGLRYEYTNGTTNTEYFRLLSTGIAHYLSPTDGARIQLQSLTGSAGDETGIIFKNSSDTSVNFFKGGIFFEDNSSSSARGHMHICNNVVNDSSNADSSHAKITIEAGTGDVKIINNLKVGNGVAGTDYTLTFNGETNDGVITWMEDEDYFKFDDDILLPDNESVILGTGGDMKIYYDGTDGYIATDIVAASDLKIDCGSQKTVELQTTVWNDLVVSMSSVRLPAANPPTVTAYKSGQVLAFSSASDNYVYFNVQLPHTYKEGTDIKFHIHYAIPTAGAGAGVENIKFDLTYSWANADGTFNAASSGTATIDVQNTSADTHEIDGIATITGTGKNVSSVLICSLKRDTGVANDYTDDVYVISADFHNETDTIGSRQEFTK
jgi:hypothetical protein